MNESSSAPELEYKTEILICQISATIITLFGLVGNTFAYLTADNFPQKTSGQNFIKCLAVSDVIAGFQDGIMEAMLAMFGFNFFALHPMLCRFLGWFTYFSSSAGKNKEIFKASHMHNFQITFKGF